MRNVTNHVFGHIDGVCLAFAGKGQTHRSVLKSIRLNQIFVACPFVVGLVGVVLDGRA